MSGKAESNGGKSLRPGPCPTTTDPRIIPIVLLRTEFRPFFKDSARARKMSYACRNDSAGRGRVGAPRVPVRGQVANCGPIQVLRTLRGR